MIRFSFRTKSKQRKPLIAVPPQLASYDPVFDTLNLIENDYHRFCRRAAEQHR